MKRTFFILTLALLSVEIFSQNPFEKFQFLIGNWQGVETGVAGNGIGFRTYKFELGENYIFERNSSTFPITEKKPYGEVHRDIGVFSFNTNDSSIVYRSFNVEGFTNIYVLDKKSSTSTELVFITREIENNPGNWKAKTIIKKMSDTEFVEIFDIAMDGVNYKPFIKNTWRKVK